MRGAISRDSKTAAAIAHALLVGLLAGCAGSAEGQRAPASPAAAPAPQQPAGYAQPPPMAESKVAPASPAGAGAPPTPAPVAAAAPPADTQAAPATSEASRDRSSSRAANRTGLRDLDKAEREIASGDCATACRALGSMERAVSFLCAQTDADGNASGCADARARLAASRRRVRTSCTSCAGGPSVDPDAPIPSR